ncbi:hypothetical protein KKG66_01735 [bacterium]|nr:hypothetical protein [bacterium]
MDDKSKRRIRAIAKRLHWLVQLIIFVVLVARMIFLYAGTQITDNVFQEIVSWKPLSDASNNVLEAVTWNDERLLSSMFAFPPPLDTELLESWADSIQKHLDRPVSVFIHRDGKTRWITEHAHMLSAKAMAESLLVGSLPKRAYEQRVGEFIVTKDFYVLPDSSTLYVKCYQQTGRDDQWGIITASLDSWRAFIKALNSYQKDNVPDKRVMWIEMDLNVSGASLNKHGFRIFIHDSLMFESPHIDTTAYSYSSNSGGVTREFFLSNAEQQWRDRAAGKLQEEWMMTWGWFDWVGVIKWIALSFIIALFYHWILKLTSPEIKNVTSVGGLGSSE